MSRRTKRRSYGGSHDMKRLFPEKEGVDYSALKMTPEGEYSITKRADGQRILRAMMSMIGSPRRKTITDLTGNVGGDTILFGLHFKHVHSIEINPENFDALQNNVRVFGLKNVELHQGDATKIYNWYTDVLYLDPPWGGPSYKEHKELDLHLGTRRVDLYLAQILKKPWRPAYIFMKLPRNYNFDRLEALPNVSDILHFEIRGYDLIGIKTEPFKEKA